MILKVIFGRAYFSLEDPHARSLSRSHLHRIHFFSAVNRNDGTATLFFFFFFSEPVGKINIDSNYLFSRYLLS